MIRRDQRHQSPWTVDAVAAEEREAVRWPVDWALSGLRGSRHSVHGSSVSRCCSEDQQHCPDRSSADQQHQWQREEEEREDEHHRHR